jgi:hypothetical protein
VGWRVLAFLFDDVFLEAFAGLGGLDGRLVGGFGAVVL